MLTNVLFGQVRSGAADPASVKATESPQRQQTNRSFSDHMDDRARRDEAKSASDRERAHQAEKAGERQDAKERANAVDQNRSDASKPGAGQGATQSADAPRAKEAIKPAKAVAEKSETEGASHGQTEETPEGVAASDSIETDVSASDVASDTVAASDIIGTGVSDSDAASDAVAVGDAEIAAQTTEVPPLGMRQDTDIKSNTANSATDTEASGKARKSAGVASASAAVAGGEGDEITAQLTLAEAAPESMGDSVEDGVAPASGKSAQPAAGGATTQAPTQAPTAAAQAAVQAAATQNAAAAAAVDPGQKVALEQELSNRAEVASTTPSGATIAQDGTPRSGESRSAPVKPTPQSQVAGADVSAPTKAAQADEPTVETTADTAQRETTGKTASSGEVLAAVAGQTRTTAATEPGRRAEGRARESREAQAVVSGNAAATPATKPTAAAAQISAVQQAFAAQVLAGDASGAGAQNADAQVLSSDLPSNLPGLSQLLTEAVVQPGTVHRPETPRLVAVQLAEAIVAKGDRNVDVALNPEELGRVKMRVSTSETGITVVIQTERAETGDLMRRHINELADEFRKMGFTNVSFEFNGGGASGGNTSREGDSQSGSRTSGADGLDDLTSAELAETQIQHLRLGNAGVDMRV